MAEIVLHNSAISGNAYKVRLILAHLGIRHRRIEYNVDDGSTRRPEYLALNPNGKVPAVTLADGTCLAESNAILYYFAEGTKYWPEERLARAEALQWMFFEQYSHEPYIAVVRHWVAHLGRTRERGSFPADQRGERAVGDGEPLVEAVLSRDRFTIADIALYAYHVAHEAALT
jgi:glutathione S-transferase